MKTLHHFLIPAGYSVKNVSYLHNIYGDLDHRRTLVIATNFFECQLRSYKQVKVYITMITADQLFGLKFHNYQKNLNKLSEICRAKF